jgi:hypothetical protein
MSGPNNFISEHDSVIYFTQFPGVFFTDLSGGEDRRDVGLAHTGVNGEPPEPIDGPSEVGQVTVMKPYDPVRDAPLDAWAAAYRRGIKLRITCVKQPTTSEGVPFGKPDTYLKCSLVSYKRPNVRKGSSETAMLEIVLQPSTLT